MREDRDTPDSERFQNKSLEDFRAFANHNYGIKSRYDILSDIYKMKSQNYCIKIHNYDIKVTILTFLYPNCDIKSQNYDLACHHFGFLS